MTRKPAIKPDNIQITYSRIPNLQDMLVKSSLFTTQTQTISTMLATKMPTLSPHEHLNSDLQ